MDDNTGLPEPLNQLINSLRAEASAYLLSSFENISYSVGTIQTPFGSITNSSIDDAFAVLAEILQQVKVKNSWFFFFFFFFFVQQTKI
jgi:hypothetical protein